MSLPIVEGVEFRAIEGWPGYAVGNDGSVWSCRVCGRARQRQCSHWRKMKLASDKAGYSVVALNNEGVRKQKKVHRLVLESFVGPCPDGMECCHKNGVRYDNVVSNLRWDTTAGNIADKRLHGTLMRGDSHANSKLNSDQVREIRKLRLGGMNQRILSEMFGVSISHIKDIVLGRKWAHI